MARSLVDTNILVDRRCDNGGSDSRLSFWDALIWATARDAGVRVVLSEDFQDGQEIEGVRFVNPFKQP